MSENQFKEVMISLLDKIKARVERGEPCGFLVKILGNLEREHGPSSPSAPVKYQYTDRV